MRLKYKLYIIILLFIFQILDSGVMSSLDDFTRVCQPKLVVFDLYTDQVVRTVYLPNGVLRPSSLMTNLAIDESLQGRCDSAFVYMTDTAAPGTHFSNIPTFEKTDKRLRFTEISKENNHIGLTS